MQGAATQVANWSQVPVVFGILAFVYAGHGVFPAIQAGMKKPKDFPKVVPFLKASPLGAFQTAKTRLGQTLHVGEGQASAVRLSYSGPELLQA